MTILRAWLLLACTTLFTTTWAAEKPIPTSASSTFPQCGIDCNILNSAQDSCVSGAESTWTSCFCESSLLTSLKSSGSLCSNCGASDQSTLSSWYNSYCKSGGTTSTGNSDSDKDSDKSSTATASTSTSTATAVASASKNATEENKSWWSTHYKWVVMLIVLVVGFTLLAILGVWLKRRYEAKRPHLYAGPNGSSSGALGAKSASGLMSPPQPGWAQHPVPAQPGVIPVPAPVPAGSGSLASSSRTDVAPKGVVPQTQTQGRLQKPPQSVADVEIRQVSR